MTRETMPVPDHTLAKMSTDDHGSARVHLCTNESHCAHVNTCTNLLLLIVLFRVQGFKIGPVTHSLCVLSCLGTAVGPRMFKTCVQLANSPGTWDGSLLTRLAPGMEVC